MSDRRRPRSRARPLGSAGVRLGLIRRATAALATAAVAVILVSAAAPGALAQTPVDSEGLLNYLTTGKLKLKKRITYKFVCSTDCQVTASSTLVLRGPDVGPIVDTGSFPAGQIIEVFLKPNKSARRSIRKHLGASKLRTSVTAINPGPYGENDTDTRVFRFKR
jgi:3D (Asp-Asp-Asp) domain-containing protein